jgi:hypothetical protein
MDFRTIFWPVFALGADRAVLAGELPWGIHGVSALANARVKPPTGGDEPQCIWTGLLANYENWLCLAEDTKWRHHLARRVACLETAGLSLLPLCSTDRSSSVQVYVESPGNLMRSNNARYNLALIMSHWILALMLLISQTMRGRGGG